MSEDRRKLFKSSITFLLGDPAQVIQWASDPMKASAPAPRNVVSEWTPPAPMHRSRLFDLLPHVIEYAHRHARWPKQEAMIAHLREAFGLSLTEARAVDAVTRPDELRRKHPGRENVPSGARRPRPFG
jgi:hypothetical protein